MEGFLTFIIVYARDKYFKEAISTGSAELVRLYLKAGMPVKEDHLWEVRPYLKNAKEILDLCVLIGLIKA